MTLHYRAALLLALCSGSASAQPAQPRHMSFDDVLAMKAVGDAQVSPDGRWVAYTVTRADLELNASDSDVWLVAATGGTPVRLTTSRKGDSSPRWSPDGRRIAFISSREERPQLHAISPFGGEADRLMEHKGAIRQFAWAPDGASIAVIADPEPTAEQERRIKEKDDAIVVDTNYTFARLFVLDVGTGKARLLPVGDRVVTDAQWSPDGRQIAYVTTPTPRADDGSQSDIWVIPAGGGTPRLLLDNPGPDNAPRWSPDGRQIAFTTAARSDVRQSRLAVIGAEGGTPRTVAPAFPYSAGAPAWSADGATLYFSAPVRTSTLIFSVPASGGTPRALVAAGGVRSGVTYAAAGTAMAYVRGDVQRPGDVHLARLEGGMLKETRLSDHNPQVRELALGRSETVRWKSTDGMEMEGILILPVGYRAGERYPLVANIHGGPAGVWTESFPAGWGNTGHLLAGQGFAVFYPNPRGSSAYGEPFLRANIRDWGGGDYQDIQSGIDALVARGIADSTRLAQTGWSYGGYMTAWTATQTSRFKALVVGAGLTDMTSMHSTNDLPTTVEHYFGAEPWNDTTGYRRRSAMTFIKNARTPTLILHGQADLRVPIGQAQQLYMGLKKNGVPTQLVFYPREPHGLQEPRHQLDKMRRENEWIRRWVLGDGRTALVP